MQYLIGLFACSEPLPRQCLAAQRPLERVGAGASSACAQGLLLPAGMGGQRAAAGSGWTCSLPYSCSSSVVVDSLDVKVLETPLLSFLTSSPARMENSPWCWGAAASLLWSPRCRGDTSWINRRPFARGGTGVSLAGTGRCVFLVLKWGYKQAGC